MRIFLSGVWSIRKEYHALTQLGIESLVCILKFDRFPLYKPRNQMLQAVGSIFIILSWVYEIPTRNFLVMCTMYVFCNL